MDLSIIDTTLQTIAKVVNEVMNVANYSKTKSLADVTKLTRVEPLVIISKDCLNLDYMPDIQQSVLSIFAAYYLQAIDILTKVKDVEVVRILDALNPDRDETGFLLSESLSRESALLSLEAYKYSLPRDGVLSLEAGDKSRDLNEIVNLSVGRLINVSIAYTAGQKGDSAATDKTVNIPISIRLIASSIPTQSIVDLVTLHKNDNTLVERYHAWRSGRISFIKDLIFCQDLIDEYKRAAMDDQQGTLQEIIRRVNNSKKYGILTKNPSMVSASNIFVISEDNKRQIEAKLGGKLSDPKIRQKAFDNTYAMILVVVDREWERVTFYIRNINAASDLSVKEIKAAAKGKGPDIADLLKAMNQGIPPMF